MITKIVSFPPWHFERKKQLPLSRLMITTLLDACEKQHDGNSFGPADLKGSFTTLIARGLIARNEVTIDHHTKSSWYVTKEAIGLLKVMGIEAPC